MSVKTDYSAVQKFLHWLIFLLVAAQFAIGELMPHITRRTPYTGLVAWHAAVGTAILFFIIVRLLWRVGRPVTLLPASPPWHNSLAHVTHWGLYALLFVMVLTGWAATSYLGWDLRLFGVLPLPPLAEEKTQWAHTAGDVHGLLVWALVAAVALHVAAALYHYFFLKDRVLQRMMP